MSSMASQNGFVPRSKTAPEHVFIFSMPRTASNLLAKMLSKQEHVAQKLYSYEEGFQESMEVVAVNSGKATEKESDIVLQQFNTEWAKLQKDFKEAVANGDALMVKEHVSHVIPPGRFWTSTFGDMDVKLSSADTTSNAWTSGSIYPDAFLLRWFPVFLIRHPALAFPSFLRLIWSPESNLPSLLAASFFNFKFTRELYEWYAANNTGKAPLIIDADQLMRPDESDVLSIFCERARFDKERILYKWNPATAEDKANTPYKHLWRALKTIKESSGIVAGLTADNISIDSEVVKWKAEFGDKGADLLEKHVRAAMADYEWLKQRSGR